MNMNYGWRREIKHCPAGHEYNEENTYRSKTPGSEGERSCRVCAHARYEKNKEVIKARSLQWKRDHPEERRAQQQRNRDKHREKYRIKARRNGKTKRDKRKRELLEAYGNKCTWCGQARIEFLQLDHILNDGKADREQYSSPTEVYRWVREQGYPKDRYQLLCGNCHSAKSFYKMTKEQVLAGPIDLHLE